MNTHDQLARMQEWLDTHPTSRMPRDPAADYDEDTLRRSFGFGLSKSARREQRRPKPFTSDEVGYLPNGSWTPGSAA